MKLLSKSIVLLAIAFIAGSLIITALPTYNFVQALLGLALGIVGFWVMGRGGRTAGRERLRVGLDFVSLVLFAVFFLSIVFGGLGGVIQSNQPSVNLAEFLISFWMGGLIMGIVTLSIYLKPIIGKKLFNKVTLYVVLSFAMFFIADLAIPPTVPLIFKQALILPNGALSQTGNFVTTMISVPEETVFRGWLAPWLGNISHTGKIGGTIGSAFFFVVYHLFVYGTNPALLLIIFADGLVQGWAALNTGLLATTITTHLTNNFLSVQTGI